MNEKFDIRTNRRKFLRGAIGVGGGLVALAAGCKPQSKSQEEVKPFEIDQVEAPADTAGPVLPEGMNPDMFHLHSIRPLSLETKRSSFGIAPLTPTSLFFVRNNLPMPDRSIVENADAWELEITGVKNPRNLTVGELKKMPFETVISILQCSGNGRKFFKHGPSGSPWATGAAACPVWTGVLVKDVIDLLGGTVDEAKYMTSSGGEILPEGVDPLQAMVERSIPKEKGLGNCILAWEMNGEPLPITHGGPLRLIVPGYFGVNNIKYVNRIAFTNEQTQAKIQKTGYRFRPIGVKGDPSQPTMWRMNVKSWVNGPGADDEPVLQGKVGFYGVALSGERGISKVEYTLDNGKSWKDAAFIDPDLGKNAFRSFTFEADLKPGTYTVATRAIDIEGDTQPEHRVENERGYGNNSWQDHVLTINVVDKLPEKIVLGKTETTAEAVKKPAKEAQLSEQGKKGKKIFLEETQPTCGTCHTLGDAGTTGAVGPNLNDLKPTEEQVTAAVTDGVGIMPSYKERLTEEKVKDIAKYVFEATK